MNNTLSKIKLIGSSLVTVAEFRDINKVKIVPSGVSLKYKKPSGIVSTVTSTFDAALSTYTGTILLDEAGLWNVRWECTGTYASAEEFEVQVLPSKI